MERSDWIPPICGGKRKYLERKEGGAILARAWMAEPEQPFPITAELADIFEKRLAEVLFPAAKPGGQPIEYCFFVRERRLGAVYGTVVEYQTRRGRELLAFSLLSFLTGEDRQTLLPPEIVIGRRGKKCRPFCLGERGLLPLAVREITGAVCVTKGEAFRQMVEKGEEIAFLPGLAKSAKLATEFQNSY